MSDSMRAGLPNKGHGGLVAAAILMLLAAGGLVFWKLNSESKPEVIEETAPVATVVEPPAPVHNAPPPPPPEEEEEPEQKVTSVPSSLEPQKPKGPVGCGGPCNGEVTSALNAALSGRGSMARSCYMAALSRNPTLTGKMTMSVRVSPTGGVCYANPTNDTLGDPATAACVAAKFRGSGFPAPGGGCADVNVPLNFTKQ